MFNFNSDGNESVFFCLCEIKVCVSLMTDLIKQNNWK